MGEWFLLNCALPLPLPSRVYLCYSVSFNPLTLFRGPLNISFWGVMQFCLPGISSLGVKIWSFLKFHFCKIFVPWFWVLCQSLSENESKLLILQHIQFLRVLTRKFCFSTNVPYQNGHEFWTQLPTTMKYSQIVLYICMLKVKKFQECTCMRL